VCPNEVIDIDGLPEFARARSDWRYNMAKVKVIFYIPLKDNDGRILAGEIKELEAELYLQFVGWTFLGYVKGAYRMADQTCAIDESGAYAVVFEESRLGEVEQILRDFRGKTKQEAIYLEIHWAVEVRFIK
jgi:hypothetical protein